MSSQILKQSHIFPGPIRSNCLFSPSTNSQLVYTHNQNFTVLFQQEVRHMKKQSYDLTVSELSA